MAGRIPFEPFQLVESGKQLSKLTTDLVPTETADVRCRFHANNCRVPIGIAVGERRQLGYWIGERDRVEGSCRDAQPFWRADEVRSRGRGYIRAVTTGIRSVYRRVHVGTTPVTLTARRGTIPVTVANDSDQRVTVRLRLTSAKVDLPKLSDRFVLEPRRRTTQLLPVGTRATGTFPIQVEVLTPDTRERIAAGEIRLISTAFNRIALAMTGGAVGVLLLWWRFGRRRNGTDGRPGTRAR